MTTVDMTLKESMDLAGKMALGRRTKTNTTRMFFTYFALVVWLIITLFPIYWLITTSFKLPEAVVQGARYVPWVDFHPSVAAWKYLFVDYWTETKQHFLNTLLFGLVSAFFAMVLGSMGAYGLTRFNYGWRGYKNKDFSFLIISQRMGPAVAFVMPILIMFKFLHLIDSPVGMIIAYTAFNLPFVVWIMKDFFQGIPKEMEEAGFVDGYSRIEVFMKVILPLAAPGLVATFLFCLIFVWNEYLYALILTFQKATTMPILIAGQDTTRGPQWWYISALSLFTITPVVIIGLFVEKYLVKGLVKGAVRG